MCRIIFRFKNFLYHIFGVSTFNTWCSPKSGKVFLTYYIQIFYFCTIKSNPQTMKTLRTLLGCFFIISTISAQTVNPLPASGCHEGKCLNVMSKAHDASRDGDGVLGQIYNQTLCGLNYTAASTMVTQRYTPAPGVGLPATLPITLPPCVGPNGMNILQAYVWWIVSYDAASSLTPTLSITNPNSQTNTYNATLAGTAGPKCWGEIGTRIFRADVTTNISGSGNYVLNITGNTVYETDGITLLIIYRDPFAIYQGNLIIHDGLITGIGNAVTQPPHS